MTHLLSYLALVLGTAAEGEVVFVGASIAVGAGKLPALPVFVVGALGSALGDQFYFYVVRGPLRHWINRWPALASRRVRLAGLVGRYDALVAFGLRFTPGLRIALAATCAYAGVPAARFSAFNALGAVVWAAAVLAIVAFGGPALASRLHLSRLGLMIVVALGFVAVTFAVGRLLRSRVPQGSDLP